MIHIASKPCGCVVVAASDQASNIKHILGEWRDRGLTVRDVLWTVMPTLQGLPLRMIPSSEIIMRKK